MDEKLELKEDRLILLLDDIKVSFQKLYDIIG